MPHHSDASPWVRRFAPLVPRGGPVLDVACGEGRHCRLFRDLDHPVTGIDRDIADTRADGAELIGADMETDAGWPLAGRQFAGIIVTNYLWRPLLPAIRAALAPDGVLIYETFAHGNEAFGRPRNPDFLLAPGELLQACSGLTIVAYEHGIRDGRAVIQRICAVNGPGPFALS
ncbi:putative SAM-dependent methyltransferases [Magnetospirillum sp. LM-5]|uniref:class I SAM-dependent methyltransferase n=1 Tax=Magnetospirillum sp. LM-5 TaxID=2681466 RepID=UPI0013840D12|nr:methyltransferase domain-containing protein [Magnetospirillum sp. LM-5]CAA7614291.1 putative SAM-dependent methyltransferases [Magnetospirillum sp. LM-5]